MTITTKRLKSGYWHIRGSDAYGRCPCEWVQPPEWPCSEAVLRAHAFAQASEAFIRAAMESQA